MSENKGVLPVAKWKVWIWYSALFVGLGVIIFLPFTLYGKTLLWNSDGYLQYYPILVKLKQIITDLIQGKGISFWAWDTGLGADMIGNYALVLCDPFCWLVVFFPKQYLDVAYSVIVILKLYLAGLVMLGFLKYHNKENSVVLLSAVGYAFCIWGLIVLRHEFFLNQLILFPLLIWGVDHVDNKKTPNLLILSVMMSIITSLYFSYISAWIVFVYIVLKYFLEEKNKTIINFTIRIVKFMIYALIGGGLAMPILLPVIYSLLQANTGSGIDFRMLPTFKQLVRYIPAFVGIMDNSYSYGFQSMNMLIVLMIPAIIITFKKSISGYMFILCAIIAICPPIQSILNGFSYSSGRWSYVFAFFFVYAAADIQDYGIEHIPNYKKSAEIWLEIILCLSLFSTIIVKALSMTDFLIISLNLFFGMIMLNYLSIKQKATEYRVPKKLFLITLVNIVVIPIVYFNPNLGNGMNIYMSPGSAYNIYESTAMRAVDSIRDSDFYRVDTVDHPNNNGTTVREIHTPALISIYWKASTISEYLSTLDNKWQKFNDLMTNSAGTYRRVCVFSNDNRVRMDFLLGVKYFLSDSASQSGYAGFGFMKKDTVNGVDIMESVYPAGLGYVYDTAIAESDFLQYEPLEREQLLMQCVELSDKDLENSTVPIAKAAELKTNISQIPSIIYDTKGNEITRNTFTITSTEKNMTITPLQEIKESEIYLLLRNFRKEPVTAQTAWELSNLKDDKYTRRTFFSNYLSHIPYENFSIYVNAKQKNIKKRLVNAAGEAQGIRGNNDYMVNIGYYDSFNEQITLDFSNIGNYTFDSIELLAVPINSYQEQASKLSQNRFTVTNKTGNNHIWGETNSEKGGMLYLSILYNPGWKIYIDGIKADKIYHVNTAFMGVEVPAGKHEIELVYKPIGYPYTLISFGICVIVTILLESYFRKRKQGDNVQ